MTRIRIGGAVALTLLALFCWLQGLSAANRLQGLPESYRLQFSTPAPVSTTQWEQLEEEPAPYVLFREERATVTAPQFDRRQSLTLLEVAGDPRLLFPLHPMAAGAFPPPGEGACVVDKATAYALWGDTTVLGNELIWQHTEYIVAGVLDTERPLLVVHHSRKEDFAPTAALYRPAPDQAFPRQGLDKFTSSLSLTPATTTSQQRTADLLRFAALLPVWLLCLLVASSGLALLLPKRRHRIAILIMLALFTGWALGFPSLLTPEMLPTRWSDFSFWPRAIRALADSLILRWNLPGTLPGYLFLQAALLPVLSWSAAALSGFLLAWGLSWRHVLEDLA